MYVCMPADPDSIRHSQRIVTAELFLRHCSPEQIVHARQTVADLAARSARTPKSSTTTSPSSATTAHRDTCRWPSKPTAGSCGAIYPCPVQRQRHPPRVREPGNPARWTLESPATAIRTSGASGSAWPASRPTRTSSSSAHGAHQGGARSVLGRSGRGSRQDPQGRLLPMRRGGSALYLVALGVKDIPLGAELVEALAVRLAGLGVAGVVVQGVSVVGDLPARSAVRPR